MPLQTPTLPSITISTDQIVALPPDVLEPMHDQPRTQIEEDAIRKPAKAPSNCARGVWANSALAL